MQAAPRPGCRRRDGAGAPRLRGRSADAGRGAARAEGGAAVAAGAARRRAPGARRGHPSSGDGGARGLAGRPRRHADPVPARRCAGSRTWCARRRAARHRAQGRARARRAPRALRGGPIEFALAEGGRRTLANDLARDLQAWTGRRWMVALSSEPGAPTLHEQRRRSSASAGATRRATRSCRRCSPASRAPDRRRARREAERRALATEAGRRRRNRDAVADAEFDEEPTTSSVAPTAEAKPQDWRSPCAT